MTLFVRQVFWAAMFSLLPIGSAFAQPGFVYSMSTKSFTTLEPGHAALGINDSGQIVGVTTFPDPPFLGHGFIREPNSLTLLDFPGAYATSLTGINNAGQIAGQQCGGAAPLLCTGFLKNGNTFTPFGYPGATYTYANGINNFGQIAGAYRVQVIVGPNTVQDIDHGLFVDGNTLTSFDVPGAFSTWFSDVNDAREIVGSYVELVDSWPGFRYRGFRKTEGTLTLIDYPGALFTNATGINDAGQVVGNYQDQYGYSHGFIRSGNTFTSFDVLGADTFPQNINSLGDIVGSHYPRPVESTLNGFMTAIAALRLNHGVTTSLVSKLKAVLDAYSTGNATSTCNEAKAFLNFVSAQAGKKLTTAQATSLLAIGAQTSALLGCQ
jgi:probable HAF family extracellular repeat protein